MRKVWITERKGIPGQYVEWYDDTGRRRSKYFAPEYKRYVLQYKTRKFAELNADVRPVGSVIDVPWSSAKEQYLRAKRLEGLAETTLVDIRHTIALIEKYCPIPGTASIRQSLVDDFIEALQARHSHHIDREQSTKETKVRRMFSPYTINKHLSNLKAMLHYFEKKHYSKAIEIKPVKSDAKPIRVLSNAEVKNLIAACGNKQWKMRVLLAVCTGLRRGDIDRLKVKDIDVDRKTVSIVNQKTGKATIHQPLPDKLMPEISRFLLEEVDEGQVKLLKTKFTKQWDTIRKRAGLEDIDFHDLRRTFGSLQADAGVPIKALQEMYNHSSIETTMRHYITTGEGEKRNGVNTLKVEEWL
jgi:integrase